MATKKTTAKKKREGKTWIDAIEIDYVQKRGHAAARDLVVQLAEFGEAWAFDGPTAASKSIGNGKSALSNEFQVLVTLLFDNADGFPELRARFEHGLRGVNDDTLAKVRGLAAGFADAISQNDVQALEEAASLWDLYFGVDGQFERTRAAFSLVEVLRSATRKRVEDEPDREQSRVHFAVEITLMKLGTLDERFRCLDPAFVQSVVESDTGPGKMGNRAALALLMEACGAFDCTSHDDARKKIKRALDRKPKATSQLKKATKRR